MQNIKNTPSRTFRQYCDVLRHFADHPQGILHQTSIYKTQMNY